MRTNLFVKRNTVGQQARVRHISIQGLVPQTDNYITYDGSLTQPGCQETVTWIIINKPLYISVDNVRRLLTSTDNRRERSQTHAVRL